MCLGKQEKMDQVLELLPPWRLGQCSRLLTSVCPSLGLCVYLEVNQQTESLSLCLHVCGFHCLFLCHSPCQINIKTCMMEQAFDLAVNIWAAWISHQNNWVWEATKLLNLVSHQCWHWKAEVMAQVIKFLASPWDTWIAIPAPCSSSEQCWPLQECRRMNQLKGIYWLSVT